MFMFLFLEIIFEPWYCTTVVVSCYKAKALFFLPFIPPSPSYPTLYSIIDLNLVMFIYSIYLMIKGEQLFCRFDRI